MTLGIGPPRSQSFAGTLGGKVRRAVGGIQAGLSRPNRKSIAAPTAKRQTWRVEIREAKIEDAPSACDVIRRSITELCVRDHRGDSAILGRWLASKTPENVARWIARPYCAFFVAVEGDTVLAAGQVTDAGEFLLNYVSPDARFQGVSRAMVHKLEDWARERGTLFCKLQSTETARRFYASLGYVETGPPVDFLGTVGYPMTKPL